MTVPRYDQPLDTPRQMAKRGFKWAASHDAWAFSLREASDDVFGKVYRLFTPMTEEQLQLAALKGHRVAFAVERLPSGQLAVNPLLAPAKDKLRLMREDLYWEMVVSVVGKGSFLTTPANRLARQLQESGLLLVWEERAAHKWDLAAIGHTFQTKGPTSLTTLHLIGVFVLWLIGIFISCVIFAYEVLHRRQFPP
ncbi:uncharacterized protein Ir92a [Cloeon dipterum]|uniref:uncharacterized protein Ir92a n=1 Tax=Cloeon dipterum TaxID=197152 RepID=UPI003220472B